VGRTGGAAPRPGRRAPLQGDGETATDIGGKITLGEPKTPKSCRTIPLSRNIMREVEQHLGEYVETGPDALIFTSPTGNPLYRGTVRPSVWKPAVTAAGLDGLKIMTFGTPTCR
jgi:hypothetical protein